MKKVVFFFIVSEASNIEYEREKFYLLNSKKVGKTKWFDTIWQSTNLISQENVSEATRVFSPKYLFGAFQTLCLGYIREWLYGVGPLTGLDQVYGEETQPGYAPLLNNSFESFYARNVYRRFKHSWHPVIVSVPGAKVTIADRVSDNEFWTFRLPKEEVIPSKEYINLSSYNYLGFAENR